MGLCILGQLHPLFLPVEPHNPPQLSNPDSSSYIFITNLPTDTVAHIQKHFDIHKCKMLRFDKHTIIQAYLRTNQHMLFVQAHNCAF